MKWNWKFKMNKELVRKWGLPLCLVAAGVALVLVCGGQDGPAPQKLSLQELAEKGPGDNPHVVVSDFLLLNFSYVYEEEDGVRHQVWMPAVPRDGKYHQELLSAIDEEGQPKKEIPLPDDIRVLVKKSEGLSDEELNELADRKTIAGTIVNETSPLGDAEKDLLGDSYPGIDFDRCWVLEVKARAGSLSVLRVLGVLLIAAGLAWVAWPALKKRTQGKGKKGTSDVAVAAGHSESSQS